jgi:hypothetical protein
VRVVFEKLITARRSLHRNARTDGQPLMIFTRRWKSGRATILRERVVVKVVSKQIGWSRK